MNTEQDIRKTLNRIDRRGYKAYKDLQGSYKFSDFTLICDYIQGDPFAAPSKFRVRIDQKVAGYDTILYETRVRTVALEDYLARAFAIVASKVAKGNRGTGKSGMIAIDRCGQEILERSAIVVNSEFVEARFSVGLPARGRSVLGKEASEMILGEIPKIARASLLYKNLRSDEIKRHVELCEDAQYIRDQLKSKGLVSFIKDGSILPRQSGISDRPMDSRQAVPFNSPESLRLSFNLPNAGTISGMGIREGVTLIVGGGYHGKSTLLRAIERGVYNHISGDGREYVITRPDAFKIRAEDGRRVEKVNISPFINNLPYGGDTYAFSTEEASGSTSQAANIMEALEVGSRALLIDEDTSATNFMIRDVRMQELVSKEKEPITPYIDKIRQLYEDKGVSTIIVVGGSGDYFDVSDTVIMMDEYKPGDVTSDAREIAGKYQSKRKDEGGREFGQVTSRVPLPHSFNARKGRKEKVDARGLHTILFGRDTISLNYVEQLVNVSQTRAIGDIILYSLSNYMDGKATLAQIIEKVMADIDKKGLDVISSFYGQHPGEYALPRKYEVACAINRLRSLKVST